VSGVFIAVGKIMESLNVLDVRICRISPSGFLSFSPFCSDFLICVLFISTFPSQNELSVIPVSAAV
jgi:hypothetical protein